MCSYHETQTQDKTQGEPQEIGRSSCTPKIKEEIKEIIVEILQEAPCYPEIFSTTSKDISLRGISQADESIYYASSNGEIHTTAS